MARLGHGSARQGYTLVEMLVATTLTLVMMGAVATVFGMIGEGISAARASLEMADALRATAERLRGDLKGATQTVGPPHFQEWSDGQGAADEGYFEYLEGTLGPVTVPAVFAGNDETVIDTDDILLFTTRSRGEPFVGRYVIAATAIEAQDAEVAWFVRGRTLYRRVLLVRPDLNRTDPTGFYCLPGVAANGFYNLYDLSARLERDLSGNLKVVANSLADLTRRECRYAHHYRGPGAGGDDTYPFSAGRWSQSVLNVPGLGLPTLGECSHGTWVVDRMNPTTVLGGVTFSATMDYWVNPFLGWTGVDQETGTVSAYIGPRVGEDVILSNVIGFDVKAWDPSAPVRVVRATRAGVATVTAVYPGDPPHLAETNNPNAPNFTGYAQVAARAGTNATDNGATPPIAYQYYDDVNENGSLDAGEPTVLGYGAYVDLGYGGSSLFGGVNYDATGANPGPRSDLTRVYDTWSQHYEWDGVKETGNQSGLATDAGTNGFDDNNAGDPGYGLVDDWYEMETQAPYPVPLRGIQVKIRVFEPDSRQIREVTIVHSFLPL